MLLTCQAGELKYREGVDPVTTCHRFTCHPGSTPCPCAAALPLEKCLLRQYHPTKKTRQRRVVDDAYLQTQSTLRALLAIALLAMLFLLAMEWKLFLH